jgi:hypothetical protein
MVVLYSWFVKPVGIPITVGDSYSLYQFCNLNCYLLPFFSIFPATIEH